MRSQFEKLVQNFKLKRVGGAPKGHPFAPLVETLGFVDLGGVWAFPADLRVVAL